MDRQMSRRCGAVLGLLLGMLILWGSPAAAQSVTGGTSLIRIPTARMPEDGLVRLSAGFMPHQHATYGDAVHDRTNFAASMGFLPFLEVGFRFSPQINSRDALGDRMVFVRARVLTEKGARPAVVIGLHDFLQSSGSSTTKFHSFYVAASKRLDVPASLPFREMEVHAGYAAKVFSMKGYEFVGPFGGVSVTLFSFMDLIAEYDSHTFLIGQRLRILNTFQIVTALQQFDSFTGGATLLIHL